MIVLLNKPFGVICQFSAHPTHADLSSLISTPNIYPAGRLDTDSEGLLLLTDDGQLQHHISHPLHKKPKTYCIQVEGAPSETACAQLRAGVLLKDGMSAPCMVHLIDEPLWLWPRTPPIRQRAMIPTHWLQITLTEGRNRQVRRMSAAVGLPTLRLIRTHVGDYSLWSHSTDILTLGQSVWADTTPAITSTHPRTKRPAHTSRGVQLNRNARQYASPHSTRPTKK